MGEDDIGLCLFDVRYHLINPFIINYGIAVDLAEEVKFDIQEPAGSFGFFGANASCFRLGFAVDASFTPGKVDACYVMTGSTELGKSTATTALRIVGMATDTKDL